MDLPGHRFVVKLDADEVTLSLGRLKVDPELGIAFRLNVVRNVLAVDRHDDLEISGPGM